MKVRMILFVMMCTIAFFGCGKKPPEGVYEGKGVYIKFEPLGESQVAKIWNLVDYKTPGPHISTPLVKKDDGSFDLKFPMSTASLIPTEQGLSLLNGNFTTILKRLDLKKVSHPARADDELGKLVKVQLDEHYFKPYAGVDMFRCNSFGSKKLRGTKLKHVQEMLTKAKLSEVKVQKVDSEIATSYALSGKLVMPAHESLQDGKKCVKYKKMLMMGRRCVKSRPAKYAVKNQPLQFDIKSTIHYSKVFGHKDNQIKHSVGLPQLGEANDARDFCAYSLWPKGQLTEELVKEEEK